MNYTLQEWLNLAFRWIARLRRDHVGRRDVLLHVARPALPHDRSRSGVDGAQRRVLRRQENEEPSPTHTLHWFKWEAAFTWLSGMLLLILVYYLGGALVDGEPFKPSFATAAIGIGVAVRRLDRLRPAWLSPLANNEPVAIVISFALLIVRGVVAAARDEQPRGVLARRRAPRHADGEQRLGRIIPAQKQMVAPRAKAASPTPSSPSAPSSARSTTRTSSCRW
jgi:hypothetical protein